MLPEIPPIPFVYELLTFEEVRQQIRKCESNHVQQVAYSSYMDALTQVCFTEQRVRSTIIWTGNTSWTPKEIDD